VVFDPGSRYAHAEPYTVVDGRGRVVPVVPAFEPPAQTLLGVHLRLEGQRLDHLAHRYLADATAFWRICELNGVMLPDALAEAREIPVPRRER
jgi:hypothetical protein